jgi:hypothetical protein
VSLADRDYMRWPFWRPGEMSEPAPQQWDQPPVRNPGHVERVRSARRERRQARIFTLVNWLAIAAVLVSLAFTARELWPSDPNQQVKIFNWISAHSGPK